MDDSKGHFKTWQYRYVHAPRVATLQTWTKLVRPWRRAFCMPYPVHIGQLQIVAECPVPFSTIADSRSKRRLGASSTLLSPWRQVDYQCKIMKPRQELRKGPVETGYSMLLDFVSPLHITSFVQAVRYHHQSAAASIAGFAILKAVTTYLLVLTPVAVTEPRNVTLTTAFDSASFWKTVPADAFYVDMSLGLDRGGYSNISAHSVRSYLKTLQKDSAYSK